MVLTQAFNGAGDTRTPTLINLGLPLDASRSRWPGCWRTQLGFGPTGVFIAVSVAFSVLAVVSAFLFRLGSWKMKRI